MTIAPAEFAPTPEIASDRLEYHRLRGTMIDRIVAHADGIPLADGCGNNPPWAADFPQEGDVDAARMLHQGGLVLDDGGGYFGARVITERSSGRAIGTIGFFGPPIDGEVEVGHCALAPAPRLCFRSRGRRCRPRLQQTGGGPGSGKHAAGQHRLAESSRGQRLHAVGTARTRVSLRSEPPGSPPH